MRILTLAIAIALLPRPALTAEPAATPASVPQKTVGNAACSRGETWTYSDTITLDWRRELEAFLSRKNSAVRGFAEALSLRARATTAESRTLGEYWISRALYEAKLVHIALNGFSSLASKEPTPETVGIQTAALECLNVIHRDFPAIAFPESVGAMLPKYRAAGGRNDVVWESTINELKRRMSLDAPRAEVQQTLETIAGGGAYESFARGLWSARISDHAATISEFEKFLAPTIKIPAPLKRYIDQARLLISRSYYSTGRHEKAIRHLKNISKSSNEMAKALSELGWNYLMSEKYAEAVGTALNLQSGGLRHTFAPEAQMVMAMALNEICQYPESLKAVGVFRKKYEKAYRWLDAWNSRQNRDEAERLYPQAIQFLKKQSQVPDKVASEWLRSPVFISAQEEINLLFDETESTTALGRAGSREQAKLAHEIRQLARELKVKIRKARTKLGPGDQLPGGIKDDLQTLKSLVTHFRRFQAGAPVWRVILANYQRQAPGIQKRLIAGINEDLSDRSLKMLRQLEEIAENNQLIEVEIYNGASEDIIWQNAHPDYKDVAKDMKDEQRKATAEKVWDWGRSAAADHDADTEIWEDELGSFKADLYDNCSSKDKFLALKRVKMAAQAAN